MLGLLTGIAGISLYLVQRKRAGERSAVQRRLPLQWPLNPRPLANTAERRVWHWLRQVFPDHHVMIKLPVTRFTTPREHGAATEWFDLLSGAYCTYTVCNGQGQVVGCIDLLGPQGLSRGNRQLKQTLLAQCGIGYWVLVPDSLPAADALRADFLGSYAPDSRPAPPTEQDRLEEAALQLHQALDRNRSFRQRMAVRPSHADDGDSLAAGEQTPWPQADSFLGSLDSRRTPLEKE
ncbi:DUF2726 domain-containing protein [Ottowia sp.]|uniref:DUF2726 domain-containing protein n=1 Tax=Ottowia sp. TaxID=1898956 RepID=UPI0039E26CF3